MSSDTLVLVPRVHSRVDVQEYEVIEVDTLGSVATSSSLAIQ